ncbi:chromobox protein homolog 3 [Bicyclus anynana]|uniref:Chromobox protein homolog 3 n=1 Tax=Bicyclus anynana TaxID=110368 RepID=A0ABM3LS21_BICAN|nr:chromobox protein homolog 3 [Bicyclus anynana]
MRKVSKNRADDDVVSSTNGSGSVANEERQDADQPEDQNDREDDEKSADEADDKSDEDFVESRKKSKSKASKKKKSDRKSSKKDEEDQEEEYEVEKIIDSKRIKGKLHYLIRWKGYSSSNDTWEPQNTLSCPELISKFNEEKENSKNSSPKKGTKRKGSKKASKSQSPAKKPKTVWDEKNVDENAEYEVERILEVHHKKNGDRSFLIHWKGWSNKFDSWEPESNLNCPELIKRFMDKVDVARSKDARSLRVAPESTLRFTLQDPSSGRRLSKRRGQRQRVRYDNAE